MGPQEKVNKVCSGVCFLNNLKCCINDFVTDGKLFSYRLRAYIHFFFSNSVLPRNTVSTTHLFQKAFSFVSEGVLLANFSLIFM